MARIHPSTPLKAPTSAGDYRERDILRHLQDGLPDSFDIFHNLGWSAIQYSQQGFGEYDIVVVSPGGGLLILEIKAGSITTTDTGLSKTYGGKDKDIGLQMRRQHASLLKRMEEGALPQAHIAALLVLPDTLVQSDIVAYPRERILDAGQIEQLCALVQTSFGTTALPDDQRQRILNYLSNYLDVLPDVAYHIGQVQEISTQLASGLATWVPRIQHLDQIYQIEATAGSGKTQLALKLLRDATTAGQKAMYVCYNRPLADHLASLAPPSCEVTTFHQLCRDHAERQGPPLDFADPQVFECMTKQYLKDAPSLPQRLSLLILDESQDLDPSWVDALSQALLPDGRLYLMGDQQQQMYVRESFDLQGAVRIECMDNFRSPQRVVDMVNRLQLTPQPVQARSPHVGEMPNFYVWTSDNIRSSNSANGQLQACLQQLWAAGYNPEQVAVISWHGLQQSGMLKQVQLGGHPTRRFNGNYDSGGNPQWTDGTLLVESIYRFKGQSAPAVVLCEVDFEILTERDKRKLFVGLTRAQLRVDVVISQRGAQALAAML